MSNNQEDQQQQQQQNALLTRQQQQQQQQQQQHQQPPYRFYTEQHEQPSYQPSHYQNAYFPNNVNSNNYYGLGQAYTNPALMNPNSNTNDAPLNYYQQQQQQQHLYQPYQQQHHPPSQIYQPQATMQQFSDPVVPTEPDEFIIDLLRKPQERLFLLKLELELEAFIKDEQKLRLDLPGMNSYQRLMVHRLAPYYKLNHYHDAMRKAVYVCKTFITALPSVRLPDIQLDKSESNDDNEDSSSNSTSNATTNNDPPPQFKIMRRSAGSSSPSSRTSTNDDQSKTDRKNMTYEERKMAYEEARARIFQNMEK